MKIVAPTKLTISKNIRASVFTCPPRIAIIIVIPAEKIVKNEVLAVADLGCNPKETIVGIINKGPPKPTNPSINPHPNPLRINLLNP